MGKKEGTPCRRKRFLTDNSVGWSTMQMNLLVTGGAGFIGSNFVRLALNHLPGCRGIVLDALTYAGNISTLSDVWGESRFAFYPGKIQDPTVVEGIIEAEQITHI